MKQRGGASVERLLRRIVESSINAVKPSTIFEKAFTVAGGELDAFGTHVDLTKHANVRCVAAGKSAEAMAFEVRKKLGGRVSGVVATPVAKHIGVEGFEFYKTGHPLPDNASLAAGRAILDLVKGSGRNDLLLFLLSGGGSASMFVPIEGVTPGDANRLMKALFDNGVPIDKVNLVRRHMSMLGGGKLAGLAPKQEKISLIISDVVGDDLTSIASGPTVHDESSPAQAVRFLEEMGLIERIPQSIPAALMKLQVYRPREEIEYGTVKVAASNLDALVAAEKAGVENGLNTVVLTRFWESDAKEAARAMVSVGRSIELDGVPLAAPTLVLAGGETTVKVSGNGRGGRNQHMVLCALDELLRLQEKGTPLKRTTVFSFGTDGKDGNSDSAGAYTSLAAVHDVIGGVAGIEDYITRNDSNPFFEKYGGLITTGPTDTNVMDVFGVVVT